MSTIIIAEHDNKHLENATFPCITAARALEKQVTLLVAGFQCRQVAEEAAELVGVDQVWLVDEACYEHQLPENLSELIVSFADSFNYFLAPASTFGKNLLPRVAALLDVAQLSDVTRILDNDCFEHPIYAGNAIETVKMLDEKKVMTIRPTAFNASIEKQTPCSVEVIHKAILRQNSEFIGQELSHSVRPELSAAKIVVSGGRGLQNKENFKLIETLADALGAAVGASRAAVDAGFVPNDCQVGQTGKVVAPDLYFAIGISGAVQHLAGMKDSKVIVAINKDPDAPIFQIANYGLVGDLFTFLPELIRTIQGD